MGALRGVLVGSLGLTLMYDLVTTKNAGGVTTLAGLPGRVANYIISPTVPLIPDLSSSSSSSSSSSGSLGPGVAQGTLPSNSLGGVLGSLGGAAGVLGAIGSISDVTPTPTPTPAPRTITV